MTENKNAHRGSALDDFLKNEGTLAECQAAAIKEVIAWQLRAAAILGREIRLELV